MACSMRPIKLDTDDKLAYRLNPNASGLFRFKVRAPHDAHFLLSTVEAETKPMYYIIIGGWGNTLSAIRKDHDAPAATLVSTATPEILSESEFRGFWIRWHNCTISVGKEGEGVPFIHYTDAAKIVVNFVGVCTGWGATGSWVIEQPTRKQKPNWVSAADGEVPPDAFRGGEEDGEPMYVIRAKHGNSLIPGKLVPSHRASFVGSEGKERKIPQYEVLCNFNGTWKECKGKAIPDNAIVGGLQADTGESLYVGRVLHKNMKMVGKIQPSSGKCLIPYSGKEESYEEYEILVSSSTD